MSYKVKEIFFTLQGEGFHQGREAVFLRFTGCNLWSGREEDRNKAICKFCDTDFFGMDGSLGGNYSAEELAATVAKQWSGKAGTRRFVVCTGGEPLLQLDDKLIRALHDHDFEVAIETNGTIEAPASVDWICVSPKAHTEIVQTSGDEIKIVYPQIGINPEDFKHMDFTHFFLQPMESEEWEANTSKTIEYALSHPGWKISLQMHKYIGLR